MIGYFPTIYPDELVYSYLARIGVHNGYLLYSHLSEDLYGTINYIPSIEFMDKLLPEVEQQLVGNGTVKEIVMKHTMMPFYGGFVSRKRKESAYEQIKEGTKEYYKAIPLPKRNQVKHLRICPICAKEDKECYGETYWHRIHQLLGVDVCATHGCKLVDSNTTISADKSIKLITAEETMQDIACDIECGNDAEKELALYVVQVMQGVSDFKERNIPALFYQRMVNTKYLSKRGNCKNIGILCTDFTERYKDIKHTQPADIYMSRLGNILRGKRYDFIEICQLAMLLGITADELIECEIPEDFERSNQVREFDMQVMELLNSGLGVNEVSRRLGISSLTTRKIRDNSYKTGKEKARGKGGKKRADWNKVDEELLPNVMHTIDKILNNTSDRPVRLTKSSVCRELGISYERFINCPLCIEAVNKYYETYDVYWARELVWAIKTLQKENKLINITKLQKITNLERDNIIRGHKYITDERYWQLIKDCL